MKPCKLETKTTPAPAGMHRVSIHYYMAYPGAEKKKKKAPAAKKKAPAAKKKAPSKRASKNVSTRKPRKKKAPAKMSTALVLYKAPSKMSTALVPYKAPIRLD